MPDNDTPSNITVILFTQLGMPVKLTAVPLVEATAVPLVNGCDNLAGVIEPSAGVVEIVVQLGAVDAPALVRT